MPLDAAIGRVFVPYCLGRRHGHQFWHKKLSCGVVKSLFEASIQKAQNGPSTQLIKATSCEKRWNARIKAEELSYLSSYQTRRRDNNRRSYQSSKKLVEKLALMSAHSCLDVNSLTAVVAYLRPLFFRALSLLNNFSNFCPLSMFDS